MRDPKKICFVLPSFFLERKGGSELQAYFLAKELIKKNWEVNYIRENNKKVGKKETTEHIHLYALPERHTKLKWLNISALRKLMTLIKADVWYCRGTISYLFPVWRCAKKTGGRVIWACSHDRFLSKKWKKELKRENRIREIFSRIDRYLFLHTLPKIDLILVQNKVQQERLKNNFSLEGTIVYNSQPISPARSQKRIPRVLWIGRLQQLKYPERFLELVDRLKDRPFYFVAAGRKIEETGCAEKFMALAKKMPNFQYLDEIPRENVLKLLEKSMLLINTSNEEGFPNIFIEAWMKGVPVVSLKVDPDGLIREYGLGKISESLSRMALDVDELMNNTELWKTYSQRVKQFAKEYFDIRKNVDVLLRKIERIDGKYID